MLPGPATVTRLRPTTTTDAYGDAEATGYTELAITGCALAPRVEGENNDGGRDGVPIGWTLFAPFGADIEPTDLVRLADDTVCRVDGEPARWEHPRTGTQAGQQVALIRWEG